MAPTLRKRPRLMENKCWFDLPPRIRETIIDSMDPKTRCKLSQCSKQCEKEAKKSKNYLFKLGLSVGEMKRTLDLFLKGDLELLVSHTCKDMFEWDYWLEFIGGEGKTVVIYKCKTASEVVIKWTKLETGNPEDVRTKYFNEYMNNYQHCIRSFYLNEEKQSVTVLNVGRLENLEELVVLDVAKNDVNSNILKHGFTKMKQLVSLKDIHVASLNMTFSQITRLKGEYIYVQSEEFDDENINKYLKLIKKGEIHKNARDITVYFEGGRRESIRNMLDDVDVFDYVEIEGVEEDYSFFDISTVSKFNFLSDVKKNGMFCVVLKPDRIEIEWTETAEYISLESSDSSFGWSTLPSKIREMIIDSMDSKTRCKFAECSKLCEKESKASPRYLYGILVYNTEAYGCSPELCFSVENGDNFEYRLEFSPIGKSQTMVEYKCNHEHPAKWTKKESGKPKNVRKRYLNMYLNRYKNCLRKFDFSDDFDLVTDFNTKQLERLEVLEVDDALFSLKSRNGYDIGLISTRQFSKINELLTPYIAFTFEQFSKFNGEKARLRCNEEEFTEDNILEYLKKRKHGEIHDRLNLLQIFCDTEIDLDVEFLKKGLDGFDSENNKYEDFVGFDFVSNTTEKRVFCFSCEYDYIELKWEGIESPKPID